MNGQGSPILVCAAGTTGRSRSARTMVLAILLLTICEFHGQRSLLAQPTDDSLDIRLRIDWGAVDPMHWEGHVELDQGRLGDLRSLGIGEDVPGNKWLKEQRVEFRSLSAATYDGFDLSVLAPPEATLTVRIAARQHPDQVKEFRYTVSELLRDQKTEPLFDDTENAGDKRNENEEQPEVVSLSGELLVTSCEYSFLRDRSSSARQNKWSGEWLPAERVCQRTRRIVAWFASCMPALAKLSKNMKQMFIRGPSG